MTPTLELEAAPAPAHLAQRDPEPLGLTPAGPEAGEHREARVVSLADARERRVVVGAARRLLAVADYAAVDFDAVAQAAGLHPRRVRRHFGSRMELTRATLRLPAGISGRQRARLSGAQTVTRFLEFWEDHDNAPILCAVLRAAMRDARVAREVEDVMDQALLLPMSAGLGTPDACPRVRLVTSALVGLAVTRYVLGEEPLASADHATVAAWMGPSIDCYLRGALGA
jgi:AcrR family transcriptional regulator